MVVIHDYAVALAKELMGIRLEVEFSVTGTEAWRLSTMAAAERSVG